MLGSKKKTGTNALLIIRLHGKGSWRSLPKVAGLLRCGKSCRLRWINYLRPIANFRLEDFATKVTYKKGGYKLVAILEAFEEKGLNVKQARVSCNEGFSMEAIVVAEDQAVDTRNVAETLLRAIEK